MRKPRYCKCGKELSIGNISNLCFPCKRKILFNNNIKMNKSVKLINGEIIIK